MQKREEIRNRKGNNRGRAGLHRMRTEERHSERGENCGEGKWESKKKRGTPEGGRNFLPKKTGRKKIPMKKWKRVTAGKESTGKGRDII